MTCTICGNPPPCAHSPRNAAVLLEENGQHTSAQMGGPGPSRPAETNEKQHWRHEVISRVQQHRARRGRRFDPNALELDFAPPAARADTPTSWEELDSGADEPAESLYIDERDTLTRPDPPKIIRFPASPFSRVPAPAPPVMAEGGISSSEVLLEAPRILDAAAEIPEDACASPSALAMQPAEQMELLPNFEDIQLDESSHKALGDAEPIPQPAPLGQRMIAATIDLGIAFVAALLFKVVFTQLAEENPQSRMALLCALGVGGALWLLYEYLFLVHGNATPGMLLSGLELATFEGKPVGSKGRRLRALASGLSGLALGLGYGWALVDEDQLGWHDRMTGTLVKSSNQPSAFSTQSHDGTEESGW